MNHSTTASATVTDPVCGMTIDPATAVGSSTHAGQTYHFCSRGCEAKFDDAPAQYAGHTATPSEGASCCGVRPSAEPSGHSCC